MRQLSHIVHNLRRFRESYIKALFDILKEKSISSQKLTKNDNIHEIKSLKCYGFYLLLAMRLVFSQLIDLE